MFSASILLAVAMLATGLPGLRRSQHAVQAASSPSWVKPYEVKLIDHPSEDKTSGLIGFNFNATLSTFGKVQGDGTFNWHDSKSYGGELAVCAAGIPILFALLISHHVFPRRLQRRYSRQGHQSDRRRRRRLFIQRHQRRRGRRHLGFQPKGELSTGHRQGRHDVRIL